LIGSKGDIQASRHAQAFELQDWFPRLWVEGQIRGGGAVAGPRVASARGRALVQKTFKNSTSELMKATISFSIQSLTRPTLAGSEKNSQKSTNRLLETAISLFIQPLADAASALNRRRTCVYHR